MFTGIINHLGTIQEVIKEGANAQIKIAGPLAGKLKSGSSVAVNGVCLTVIDHDQNSWTHHLMAETLKKTNLDQVEASHQVNIEAPLSHGDSLDGHFVLGHIDGQCEVIDLSKRGQDTIFTFRAPKELLSYIVTKGSVALDGTSLTVVDTHDDTFTISMFPYTLEHTIFGQIKKGYRSNIEVDIIGRYVERLFSLRNSS